MKQTNHYLLLLLLLCSLLLNGYFVVTQKAPTNTHPLATVAQVIDGDTVILKSGERIRLLGANAPEIDRCYGKEAKIALEFLLLNKQVRIAEERTDNFNRRMGLVYLENRLINTEMIANGFAKPDYSKNSQKERFIEAYDQAKEKQLGLGGSVCKHTGSDPLPNPLCPIKGNIETSSGEKFYHLPTCRHYQQIVIDLDTEEDFFCSETAAQKAGFTRAWGCDN